MQAQISEALKHHQRSFFVQWIMINAETHNWSQRPSVSAMLSHKWDIYITPFPQGSGIFMEEEE